MLMNIYKVFLLPNVRETYHLLSVAEYAINILMFKIKKNTRVEVGDCVEH